MDFQKIKSLVDKGITVDANEADEHELRYTFDDGKTWYQVTPEKYSNEEEIVAVINTDAERKQKGNLDMSVPGGDK